MANSSSWESVPPCVASLILRRTTNIGLYSCHSKGKCCDATSQGRRNAAPGFGLHSPCISPRLPRPALAGNPALSLHSACIRTAAGTARPAGTRSCRGWRASLFPPAMTEPRLPDPAALAGAVRAGDRRALARAITLIESSREDHRRAAEALLQAALPAPGTSVRLGISGAPGVGKSTFIEAFGLAAIRAGHRPAVLAIDPSSRRGGGSILGDKTRMPELARNEAAFIRPSPAGGTLGGVARRTREALLL